VSQLWVWVESFGEAGTVALSADESRHVAARRLRSGDPLIAFDGRGRTATAVVESLGRRGVELRIERVELSPLPDDRWILATAIPKADRLATMLPMLTQLGVPIWQPLVLEDSAVRDLEVASPRMRRILVESAKLARRPWLLEARAACSLDALLAAAGPAPAIAYGDREGEQTGVVADTAIVAIGPEAGFTPDELRRLRSAGARGCSLGPHNLRIETAAAAAAVARFVARVPR
jgi:16S rRNA (uracil1498-N3)-methyltransferase